MTVLATIFAIVGCATISYGFVCSIEELDRKMHMQYMKKEKQVRSNHGKEQKQKRSA